MKNNYFIENDICYIELRRKDGSIMYSLLDKEDLPVLECYNCQFYALWSPKTKTFYCVATYKVNNKWSSIRLHRLLFSNLNNKLQIDHRNHNTLDNRRKNLRIVTHHENQFNKKGKGCTFDVKRKKWRSRIMTNYKEIFLGYFESEKEAEKAYLDAKNIYHKIGDSYEL